MKADELYALKLQDEECKTQFLRLGICFTSRNLSSHSANVTISLVFSLSFSFSLDVGSLYTIMSNTDYEHYDKNRRKSQNIRNDLPVAKTFQDIEYQELLKRHQALEEM